MISSTYLNQLSLSSPAHGILGEIDGMAERCSSAGAPLTLDDTSALSRLRHLSSVIWRAREESEQLLAMEMNGYQTRSPVWVPKKKTKMYFFRDLFCAQTFLLLAVFNIRPSGPPSHLRPSGNGGFKHPLNLRSCAG